MQYVCVKGCVSVGGWGSGRGGARGEMGEKVLNEPKRLSDNILFFNGGDINSKAD